MAGEANYLDVKILGRDYRVACSPAERDALQEAVTLVDHKMRDISQRTKNSVAERVAVMAALNIAHEHLSEKKAKGSVVSDETRRKISDMGARLDAVLATGSEGGL